MWLAIKARVPLVPSGVWIADRDLFMTRVPYRHGGRRYTVDSYFPRFRARYVAVIGEPIYLDRYYDRRITAEERQALADRVLETIYRLREEARRLALRAGHRT